MSGGAGVPFIDAGGQVLANSSAAGYEPELAALSGSARWAIREIRRDAADGKTPQAYIGTQAATARWKGMIWISRNVAKQLHDAELIDIAEDKIVTIREEVTLG